MEIINDLLAQIKGLDPIILIVGGVIAVAAILLLLRFATALAVRILTIGCIVIVVVGLIFFGIQWLFN